MSDAVMVPREPTEAMIAAGSAAAARCGGWIGDGRLIETYKAMLAASTPVGGSTPGGWLIKDFADGWYWTGDRLNADMAANGGACVFSIETGQYETDPPPSVSIDNGSRPQEAVPTEGHDATVLDALTWVLPMAKGYAAAHPVGNNAGIVEAAEEALVRARSRPVVASVTLEGRQGEPAGMMTVTLHMSDGREVPIIRDNGNIISHWARVDAATPQPADGCSSNEGADQ